MNQTIKNAGLMNVNDGIATFTFEGNGHNTFPTWKMVEVAEILENLNTQEVRAVILTAGENRSFGVGGDFKEVKTFKGSDEVDEWIAACCRMYSSVLNLPIPVVASIDGYCIGIALQLALCADYRVASLKADLRMPELKLGIACVLGSCLLYERIPPHIANRMIMECKPCLAPHAYEIGLVDQVAKDLDASSLGLAAKFAQEFSQYQPTPFKTTKQYTNGAIIAKLKNACTEATKAHRAGFAASNAAQEKMAKIVGSSS